MIRNRKSQATALVVRSWIADMLARRTQLDEPLTDEAIRRELLPRQVPLSAIKRHRQWVRREFAAGRLPKLVKWIDAAKTGPLPPWDN
jgi:hypothetical protein